MKVDVDFEEDGIACWDFLRTIRVGNRFLKGLLQVHHTVRYRWGYFGEKDPCKNRIDRSIEKEARKLETVAAAAVEERTVPEFVEERKKQSCSTTESEDEGQREGKCRIEGSELLKGRKLREIVVQRG
jgi:hypothetical protein